MGEVSTRSLPIIATEINSIKEQTRNIVLYNSIEIGRRLLEAKTIVGHGEWGSWLKESVDYSQRTASNLMRIFEEYGANQTALFGDNSKSQALANLSYTQAVALLELPEDEREQFVSDNNVQDMSTRELQQAIKERDKAIKAQAAAEKKLAKETAERKKLQEALEKEREQAKLKEEQLASLLEESQQSGESDEKIKQLETALAEAKAKVEELNQKIQEPITLEPAVVEKIPEAVEQELQQLREQVKSAAQPADTAVLTYRVHFDQLVKGFDSLLDSLEKIQNEDSKSKYKQATAKLITRMSERLV
ncbi:MAG: DUF3102 domain-containing protein [Sporomusaceae bacterium]|nr:DUF3102 domain-containing protein [Sporomusaceae bacterium]